MIFVCTDEHCSTAVESEETFVKCPHCGGTMKEMKEEDLEFISFKRSKEK